MSDRELDVLDKVGQLLIAEAGADYPKETEALRISIQTLRLEHEFDKKVPAKPKTDKRATALWILSALTIIASVVAQILGIDVGGLLP